MSSNENAAKKDFTSKVVKNVASVTGKATKISNDAIASAKTTVEKEEQRVRNQATGVPLEVTLQGIEEQLYKVKFLKNIMPFSEMLLAILALYEVLRSFLTLPLPMPSVELSVIFILGLMGISRKRFKLIGASFAVFTFIQGFDMINDLFSGYVSVYIVNHIIRLGILAAITYLCFVYFSKTSEGEAYKDLFVAKMNEARNEENNRQSNNINDSATMCKECNSPVPAGNKFCINCGTKF